MKLLEASGFKVEFKFLLDKGGYLHYNHIHIDWLRRGIVHAGSITERARERWKRLCGMYGTCLGVLYESCSAREKIQRTPALTV